MVSVESNRKTDQQDDTRRLTLGPSRASTGLLGVGVGVGSGSWLMPGTTLDLGGGTSGLLAGDGWGLLVLRTLTCGPASFSPGGGTRALLEAAGLPQPRPPPL